MVIVAVKDLDTTTLSPLPLILTTKTIATTTMASGEAFCQGVFVQLLEKLTLTKPTHSVTNSMFVRELLQETAVCDKYYNLSMVRAEYESKLETEFRTFDTLYNIRTNNVEVEDQILATQVVGRCARWTRWELTKSLSWKTWVGYTGRRTWEKAVAVISAVGGECSDSEKGVALMTANSETWIREREGGSL